MKICGEDQVDTDFSWNKQILLVLDHLAERTRYENWLKYGDTLSDYTGVIFITSSPFKTEKSLSKMCV